MANPLPRGGWNSKGNLPDARFLDLAALGLIPYFPPVHPVRSLLVYITSVFVLGALAAPWIYWSVQWLAGHFSCLEELAKAPFHRYVHRSLLIVAVLGLWPFMVSLRAVSWKTVGLSSPQGQWCRLIQGFLLSLATLAVAGGIGLASGSRQWDSRIESVLPWDLLGIACSSIAVSLLEELLFRGVLFGAFRRAHPWTSALLVSSLFYAAMHFFRRVKAPPEITWTSGIEHLPRMMGWFVDLHLLMPGFLSLTLAGMALGVAYHRTGSLYLSLGLHAGWVFWLKTLNALTVMGPKAKGPFHVSKNLYDGWIGLMVSVTAAAAVWLLTRDGIRRPAANDHRFH